jgi:hypothetical protein
MHKTTLSTVCLTVLLAGCQSPGRTSPVANGTQGPEVSSICFTRQIDSWQPFGDSGFILRRGMNDYFLVEVAGTCRVRDAFAGIQLNARTGTCLTVGDTIRFRNDQGLPCSISDIYEWHPADAVGPNS